MTSTLLRRTARRFGSPPIVDQIAAVACRDGRESSGRAVSSTFSPHARVWWKRYPPRIWRECCVPNSAPPLVPEIPSPRRLQATDRMVGPPESSSTSSEEPFSARRCDRRLGIAAAATTNDSVVRLAPVSTNQVDTLHGGRGDLRADVVLEPANDHARVMSWVEPVRGSHGFKARVVEAEAVPESNKRPGIHRRGDYLPCRYRDLPSRRS